MSITKAELAVSLHEELGLNKRESKEFVEQFFETIKASLEQGSSVKLSGFGNFGLRDKPARPGRNPKTGEEINFYPEFAKKNSKEKVLESRSLDAEVVHCPS